MLQRVKFDVGIQSRPVKLPGRQSLHVEYVLNLGAGAKPSDDFNTQGASPPARPKRLSPAEDLYRLEQITDCRISPDGRHVVYAVQRVDKKTEKKYANLWIVPTRGGAPRALTLGAHRDARPRRAALVARRRAHCLPVESRRREADADIRYPVRRRRGAQAHRSERHLRRVRVVARRAAVHRPVS